MKLGCQGERGREADGRPGNDVAVAGRDEQRLWRHQRRERPWCLGV